MDQTLGSSSEDVLARPVPGGWSLTTEGRQEVDLSAAIPGWGSDMDPAVRPGVPRDKAPELGVEHLYAAIEPQVPKARIHKSTEHGQMPPIFGTSCPPRGLSGMLRDRAYRFSEGRQSRWMTLMLADRVNVVEDLLRDLSHGRLPNLAREMGLRTELQYNRAGFMRKVAVAGLLVAGVVAYRSLRASRR